MNRQTIIGGNGTIGKVVATQLAKTNVKVRIVQPNPKKVSGNEEVVSADVMELDQLIEATEGSSIIYLMLGLPYSGKAWEQGFPLAVKNTIEAARRTNAKVVYFDNVYMYGKATEAMTEETPVDPISRKGRARAKAAQVLMEAVERGDVEAMITRSADFYGPYQFDSIKTMAHRLRAGKKAQVLLADNKIHSLTYVSDAGKAVAMLANQPSAYNQVWHMPTDPAKRTAKDIVTVIAELLEVEARYRVVNKSMLAMAGWFNPLIRELGEMAYQYEQDYFFDSLKITSTYGVSATPFRQGLTEYLTQLGFMPPQAIV